MYCLNSQQVECQPFSLELRELYICHLESNPLLKANNCVDHPVCTFSSGKWLSVIHRLDCYWCSCVRTRKEIGSFSCKSRVCSLAPDLYSLPAGGQTLSSSSGVGRSLLSLSPVCSHLKSQSPSTPGSPSVQGTASLSSSPVHRKGFWKLLVKNQKGGTIHLRILPHLKLLEDSATPRLTFELEPVSWLLEPKWEVKRIGTTGT